jgi:hypothetical protein
MKSFKVILITLKWQWKSFLSTQSHCHSDTVIVVVWSWLSSPSKDDSCRSFRCTNLQNWMLIKLPHFSLSWLRGELSNTSQNYSPSWPAVRSWCLEQVRTLPSRAIILLLIMLFLSLYAPQQARGCIDCLLESMHDRFMHKYHVNMDSRGCDYIPYQYKIMHQRISIIISQPIPKCRSQATLMLQPTPIIQALKVCFPPCM